MKPPYQQIRKHHASRLTALFIQLLYRRQFEIYVSDVGGMYKPVYPRNLNFISMNYQGKFAFVGLPQDDYVLCMLHSTDSSDIYNLTEVPFAFSRMPTRRLTANVSQIMCVLEPC